MTIKLQGKWEAERMADVLCLYTIANPETRHKGWAKDCADRIRRQVEAERKAAQAKAVKEGEE